jgi:hypothetical protein
MLHNSRHKISKSEEKEKEEKITIDVEDSDTDVAGMAKGNHAVYKATISVADSVVGDATGHDTKGMDKDNDTKDNATISVDDPVVEDATGTDTMGNPTMGNHKNGSNGPDVDACRAKVVETGHDLANSAMWPASIWGTASIFPMCWACPSSCRRLEDSPLADSPLVSPHPSDWTSPAPSSTNNTRLSDQHSAMPITLTSWNYCTTSHMYDVILRLS